MKRSKRLQILTVVLVVAACATFGVLHVQERQEAIQNTDEVIMQLDADSVTALSWSYDDTSFSFHNDGGSWTYDADENFPVDPEQMEVLLSYFTEMGAAFVIESPEDLSQYGLDDPACTIEITSGEETQTVLLGDYSSMDSQRYVSIGDGNVYLVTSDPLSAFEVELDALIKNDTIPGFGTVDSIAFEGADSYDVVYRAYSEDSTATYDSEDVYFKQDGDDLAPLDTEKVDQYLDTLSGMSQDTYVTYNATEEDLATYGLDDPELSATITYTVSEEDENGETQETTETFSFALSRDAATKAAAAEAGSEETEEEDNEEATNAYVRIGDSSIIYEISESSYEALMACTYDDLRHDAVYSGVFTDITQFDVTLDGETYEITSEGEGDERVYRYNDEDLDMSNVQSALESVTVTGFTDEDAEGEEELALTLHLAGEAVPTLELVFTRVDGDRCLVTIDGTPTAYVDRSAVIDLAEAFNTIVL